MDGGEEGRQEKQGSKLLSHLLGKGTSVAIAVVGDADRGGGGDDGDGGVDDDGGGGCGDGD